MELDNYHIILIDYLYNYEYVDEYKKLFYWEIKNKIYKSLLFNDKCLEKNTLEELEKNIQEFYKLFHDFDFDRVYNNNNPILYITYLSHMKEKLK